MDKFWLWLSNKVPRELAYWCTIRLLVHATTGIWSKQEVPMLTVSDALERWGKNN